MELIIKSRNTEVSDRLRQYVTRKMAKLTRYLPDLTEARVELSALATADAAERQKVQVTLWVNGRILRGEESAGDFFASVDAVVDTLQRQIERYKGRRWYQRRRHLATLKRQEMLAAEEALEREGLAAEEGIAPSERVVRRKRFSLMPMDEEEAIEQMELLGHDFFVFYHAETGRINVIYRRRDGDYGLIDPV